MRGSKVVEMIMVIEATVAIPVGVQFEKEIISGNIPDNN